MECAELTRGDLLSNTQYKQDLFFKKISNEIRFELSQFGYSESEIVDILVKLLYSVKPSKHKSVLWFCYGRYIFENIERNVKPKTKIIQCVDCGKWFETSIFDSAKDKCDECYDEYIRAYDRNRKNDGLNCAEFKTVICCDCGKEFEVDTKNNKTNRCSDCLTIRKRELATLRKKNQRERDKLSRYQIP
jgi:hypothetical protein